MERFALAAVEIAREAGAVLRAHLAGAHTVDSKTAVHNLVTEMDREVEAYVVAELGRRFPDHDVVAEEGSGGDRGAPLRWHIDPLDGTNNYVHRYPWFAVSLGLERRDAPPDRALIAGAVYNVMLDEMFWAWQDGGAWLNGVPIQVSSEADPSRALVTTGVPYWGKTHPRTLVENFERVLVACGDVRRGGAAALDLAHVACGRLEVYFEEGIQTWDVAAGALLVREAGGRVSDYDDRVVAMPTAHILASNGAIHGAFHQMLRGKYRGTPG
jgi:myo-inositol-1(or 4)-monophosphatase